MDADITDRISDELPNVSIEFLHSGWGSWKAHADEVRTRAA
jgi:hypothetical protein